MLGVGAGDAFGPNRVNIDKEIPDVLNFSIFGSVMSRIILIHPPWDHLKSPLLSSNGEI